MVSTENVPAIALAPVLARFDPTRRCATLVAGGYFESGVDEFSLNTFALAHRLGGAVRRLHRRNKVLYDVIHNDLGMVCGADACVLPAAAPPVDLSPLRAAARVDFTVTRERTLRNRATRSMKKWLKDPSVDKRFFREGDEIRYRSRSYDQVLAGVAKENHVVPRCPLIVNEYFTDYFARLRQFTFCEHRYVVDVNSFADRDKILKGAEIYLRRTNSPHETIIAVFVDAACRNMVELSLTRDDF
jgi:hypothetical protein